MPNSLFTIAPHGPFLPRLVEGILNGPLLGDWPRDNPFWLADVTIILPTMRARFALSSAFASALGGAAILPDIRTLGMEEGDESLFLDLGDDPAPLPPIGNMDRRFLLCDLVEKRLALNGAVRNLEFQDSAPNPARTLSLADSLSVLLDEIITRGISPEALRAPPPFELDAERTQDLNANFELNLHFLEVILSQWPQILQEKGFMDASALKILQLEKHRKNLSKVFGDRPVIAAGSTGSVPATAKLLAEIMGLPRGVLVLPGLDSGLDRHALHELSELKNKPHGHSQYGLAQLLRGLGKVPADVQELAVETPSKRTEIVRHALALAKDTADWNRLRASFSPKEMETATCGIAIAEAETEQEQALVVALAVRDALANGKSVGIISPDRNFARRISVQLKRFDIDVDDSAGTPLFHSPAGRLLRLILRVVLSDFSAVDFMALLGNARMVFQMGREQLAPMARQIEMGLLRGQHPKPGLDGLKEMLKKNRNREIPHVALSLSREQGDRIGTFLDGLAPVFAPLNDMLGKKQVDVVRLVTTLMAVFETLIGSGDENPDFPGLSELQNWARNVTRTTHAGPNVNRHNIEAVLQALTSGVTVRPSRPARTDVSIWGRLEARLQSADLMILTGLNEGIWPEVADPGPWLSRSMRLHAGLEPPERQQGQAAHDFEMAMGNQNVLITYAKRIGASPALPSRLLERFCAFVDTDMTAQMQNRAKHYLDIARELDRSPTHVPAVRPAPCPPASLRPKSLSITEIETLIRSPFDLYAKYCLGLHAIDPLGTEISRRERGTLVHEVFARFVEQGHDINNKNAPQIISDIAGEVFDVLSHRPEQRDIWLIRLQNSISGFVEFERNRDPEIARRFAEIDLSLNIQVDGTDFHLRGRADRIDLRKDGTFDILDFKTGGIPAAKEMKEMLAPQLLVEAEIARQQGFKGAAPAHTNALVYLKIDAGPKGFQPIPFALPPEMDVAQASEAIMNRIRGHISAFLLSDTSVMSPRIMPRVNQTYAGNYDHLARTDEWSEIGSTGDDT